MNNIDLYLQNKLRTLKQKGLLRNVVPLQHEDNCKVGTSGATWINLSGNDYLGLATDSELVKSFYQQMQTDNLLADFGPGAAASRLMTGNSPLYNRLETKLASLYDKERCIIFNSGYHGNTGILPALAEKGDLILADKLCHASLIDGMRLSRAETIRFPHQDYERLEEILHTRRGQYKQVFLVSESIFSMDGDRADLQKLTALKKKYNCILYLDEAHAVGVMGPKGLGLAEQEGVIQDIDLLFGTFGKALAGIGGYVTCSNSIADYLINRSRTLIFTTGLPPVCLNWLLFVLDRIPLMQQERKKLQHISETMRQHFAEIGLPVRGNSQIVPIIIGDSEQTVTAAEKLRDQGYWVTAVRPPTVPEKTARLRLSFTAVMSEEDLAPLPDLLSTFISAQ